MKGLKIVLWTVLGLIAAFLLFALWYESQYSMGVIKPYEVNAPNLKKSLLIATQRSDFKDSITSAIVEHYRSTEIFINVVDITSLEKINPQEYSAIVVIHTWENWKPPIEVQSFLSRTKRDANKIVVFTTSGKGIYKMDDVDAITGESILSEVPFYVDIILKKLDSILVIPQL